MIAWVKISREIFTCFVPQDAVLWRERNAVHRPIQCRWLQSRAQRPCLCPSPGPRLNNRNLLQFPPAPLTPVKYPPSSRTATAGTSRDPRQAWRRSCASVEFRLLLFGVAADSFFFSLHNYHTLHSTVLAPTTLNRYSSYPASFITSNQFGSRNRRVYDDYPKPQNLW